jgi:hypothetical protein
METNEPNKNEGSVFFTNEELIGYLREIVKWSQLLVIVGYIALGIIVIAALVFMSGIASKFDTGVNGASQYISIMYLALAVLYYFPIKYLQNFRNAVKNGLDSKEEETVIYGFSNLKSLFKFMGIATIVMLSIYALLFVIAIFTAGSLIN